MAKPKRVKGHFVAGDPALKEQALAQARNPSGVFVPKKSNPKRRLIESELSLLAAKHGRLLKAEHVEEYASDPSSAMHGQFTWDDSVAGRKYRLIEARQLMTAYRIYNENRDIEVRALTSLEIDRHNGGGYRFMEDVLADPVLREHLLTTALHELESIERRYQHLQELEQVWGAVDEVQGILDAGKTLDSDNSDNQQPTS